MPSMARAGGPRLGGVKGLTDVHSVSSTEISSQKERFQRESLKIIRLMKSSSDQIHPNRMEFEMSDPE